jgi:3-deoxy-D-manno-octulosonic-acid transferase
MHPLLGAIYGTVGSLAKTVASVGVPGNGKLARSINARRGVLARYTAFGEQGRDRTRPLVWFHAPSVGEGLQVTPVLARLRAARPELQIAYTHFSPSAANFAARIGADFHDYLPFDTLRDMRRVVAALTPTAVVFSKLDLWPNLVQAAHEQGAPVGMISATLAASSARRGPLAAALTNDAYATLTAVGAIDAADASRLIQLGVRATAVSVTGDTRYDQVWERSQRADVTAPWLARFREQARPTLVAGSTWPADDAVLLPSWQRFATSATTPARLIIAPHEPDDAHLIPIEQWARGAGLTIARLHTPDDAQADVVLVDRVGVLGELYALADTAYVGGGFHSAGLHSVIEPAAYGAPVLFGPQHHASRDARLLRDAGGAIAVDSAETLLAALRGWFLPSHADARVTAGHAALQLVRQECGAADRATALVTALLNV